MDLPPPTCPPAAVPGNEVRPEVPVRPHLWHQSAVDRGRCAAPVARLPYSVEFRLPPRARCGPSNAVSPSRAHSEHQFLTYRSPQNIPHSRVRPGKSICFGTSAVVIHYAQIRLQNDECEVEYLGTEFPDFRFRCKCNQRRLSGQRANAPACSAGPAGRRSC